MLKDFLPVFLLEQSLVANVLWSKIQRKIDSIARGAMIGASTILVIK